MEKIDLDKCISCLRCLEICPMDVLRSDGMNPLIQYREDCQSCYLCALECPAGAIEVSPWRAFPLGQVYGLFGPES